MIGLTPEMRGRLFGLSFDSFLRLVDLIVINYLTFLQCCHLLVSSRLVGKWTENERGRLGNDSPLEPRTPLGLLSVITLCRCPNPVFSFLLSLFLYPSWCASLYLFLFLFVPLINP